MAAVQRASDEGLHTTAGDWMALPSVPEVQAAVAEAGVWVWTAGGWTVLQYVHEAARPRAVAVEAGAPCHVRYVRVLTDCTGTRLSRRGVGSARPHGSRLHGSVILRS